MDSSFWNIWVKNSISYIVLWGWGLLDIVLFSIYSMCVMGICCTVYDKLTETQFPCFVRLRQPSACDYILDTNGTDFPTVFVF